MQVSPKKDIYTQTDDVTIPVSASNELSVIDIHVQNFEDVAKMDGFVDRTMLIEELLQGKKGGPYAMIFAPSKFGKTLNLHMIRLFCDIEDKNAKTKEDVVKTPTMEDLQSSKNMKTVDCALQVQKGYSEHEYLENSKEFQSDDPKHVWVKQICTNWLNYSYLNLESLSVMKVMDGLKNLIKSLRIHWDRKPVFLVDEVDKPWVAAMESKLSEEQTGDEQLKLQAALVTGICKFVSYGLAPMDNTTPVYFLSDERFSKYYGLTAQDVETLVKRLCGLGGDAKKTEEIISDINAKYNGYYQPSCFGEYKKGARYCLFSVLNYINGGDLEDWCFWSDGGFFTGKFVSVLRKSVEIMSAIQKLYYEDSGTIEIEYQRAVDVQHILGLYREEIDPNPNAVFNFFTTRLFGT
ncbi:hypothetical protein TcasGA2_TC001998 [Tribolium castaneum]|uniref:AAA-ATPase-like domain-containing protein n=1 Tax=Tribolium castaneum TaxID=7070 RepID=D7EHY6_TRICA|nr:hypothetical protein TcasGA2_TC001998 [Tribolium castaneum]